MRSVEQHHAAEHLRDLTLGLRRERLGRLVAIDGGGLADLDLDELVVEQRLVDRCNQAVVDPVLADLDEGLQPVTEGAEMSTLLAGEHGRFVAQILDSSHSRRVASDPPGSFWRLMKVPTALLVLAATAGVSFAQPVPTAVQVTGGLGKGIDFLTSDKASRLNLRARMQLRFTQLSDEDGGAPDVTEFQARRVRLLFQGHVLGGELTYYLQLGFSNGDTESDLRLAPRDAYMTWTRFRDLQIRGGQMKVPFDRQRIVSSSAQQFVDRSIVVGELSLDRDVGVQVLSDDLLGQGGKLAYNAGVFSGDGRNRLASVPGVMVVGKIAVRPFGAFDDYVDGDLERSPTPKLAIAVAAAYNNNTNRQRSTFNTPYQFARFDYTHLTADALFKLRGLSILAEVLYRKASRPFVEQTSPTGEIEREDARNAWGYFAQAGYLVAPKVEITARFGELRPRGATAADLVEKQREAGAGLNWYLAKHDLKLQTDYFYLFGEDVSEGRHQLRVQMQLYF